MTGKTHIAAGAVVGLAAAWLMQQRGLNISSAEAYFVGGMGALGGLIPDIDIPTSKLGSKLKPLSSVIKVVFGHRSITHAPVVYIALGLLFYKLGTWCGLVFCIGALSHLLLDALNKKGIPLLYPLSKKHFRIAKLSSKGIADKVLCVAAYVLVVILCKMLWGGAFS